jgi:FlaA1/EpsC-like NDP-sugar epimerase
MRILVIGGTGTLGSAIVDRLMKDGPDEITILSRDEYKQSEMAKRYNYNRRLRFEIGDITRPETLVSFGGFKYIFHCAALKQVPTGEKFSDRFVETNYNGVINSINKYMKYSHFVNKFIYFTTDKAVLPINAYGMSKALSEIYIRNNLFNYKIFRWGNILGSRGSVIQHFVDCIKNKKSIPITDDRMTRFWIRIDDAVSFVLDNIETVTDSGTFICPCKASKVTRLVQSLGRNLSMEPVTHSAGIRPGEKLHELLKSDHDECIRSDTSPQYTDDELDELTKPFCE